MHFTVGAFDFPVLLVAKEKIIISEYENKSQEVVHK
jgi:hypothetical protein